MQISYRKLANLCSVNLSTVNTDHHDFYDIFRGLKKWLKNRDLAIKSVFRCIISIFGAKKVTIKAVMAFLNHGYKNRDGLYIIITIVRIVWTFDKNKLATVPKWYASTRRPRLLPQTKFRYSSDPEHKFGTRVRRLLQKRCTQSGACLNMPNKTNP